MFFDGPIEFMLIQIWNTLIASFCCQIDLKYNLWNKKLTQHKPTFLTSHIILYDFGLKYFTNILNINLYIYIFGNY
jgi:hypothetical protein